ncbi:hypothetical protein [Streptomyces sp. NBC_00385]|uniref:hypothetical protein n=1 Tax=Streptomyces sp. NBC_00385 TaxID=2975733 RepID=UPI002DD7E2F7|nr:hypothetical protein [Streptomyces sp. NBC_00385]WRZ08752.1 hypothetical protein OG959_38100 [Streptomyces sp. NBC_00385]
MPATASGFCAERGADPAARAEPIPDGVHQDLLDALEFARGWTAAGAAEDELPEPDEKIIDVALPARLGCAEPEATRPAPAWCPVEEWQPSGSGRAVPQLRGAPPARLRDPPLLPRVGGAPGCRRHPSPPHAFPAARRACRRRPSPG